VYHISEAGRPTHLLAKFADNKQAVKLLTYKITLLAMEFLSHATEILNRPGSLGN